jgi:hypothetical protein
MFHERGNKIMVRFVGMTTSRSSVGCHSVHSVALLTEEGGAQLFYDLVSIAGYELLPFILNLPRRVAMFRSHEVPSTFSII